MSQEEKLIGLDGSLVLHDAVFGDANAVQASADRAYSAHNNGSLERADNPADQRSGYQHRPYAWNGEESRSEQESPDTATEGAGLAPPLHAVAGIVIPYDVLLGVVILADDGQFVHVKPGPLELLHCLLGLGVGLINGNNRVLFRHVVFLLWRSGAFQRRLQPLRRAPLSRLLDREGCSDLRANYLAGDHYRNASILLTARRGVVGSHRLRLAEALRRDRTRRHSLPGQVVAHSLATLFGKPLIIVIPADAVRVTFHIQP